ncbi:MAG TPA: PDGLE domain-containing protein [Symbiobacteriaceae bacterium]
MTRRTQGLLILALVTAGVLSLFASAHPDGLERVLEDLAALPEEAPALLPALLPDYQVPAIGASALSGALAGIIGLVLTLGIAWAVFRLLSGSGRHRDVPR